MLQNLQGHWGFSRLPFGRDLAPSMLHRHSAHGEAVARITWVVSERALGLITGEVGVGKTVAVRAALAGLDQARHVVIYLGNPTVGARASTTPSSPPWDKRPGFTPRCSSRRPPTRWPPSTPSEAVSRSW
jgi:type II secretory pathway predicted ATPase ExeA